MTIVPELKTLHRLCSQGVTRPFQRLLFYFRLSKHFHCLLIYFSCAFSLKLANVCLFPVSPFILHKGWYTALYALFLVYSTSFFFLP